MAGYHLAQLNIGITTAGLESPQMADFMNNLDRINAIADAAEGFVWRLQTDEGNSTSLRPFGDDTLVNMSVWTDIDSLKAFMYKTDHVEFLRRRREWFVHQEEAILVLWWVPAGHIPSVEEARERLDRLRANGATQDAFTLRQNYPPPSD